MLPRKVFAYFAAVAAFAQSPGFFTEVYPFLKKADCRGCHNADGVSSTTRLLFPEETAGDLEWQAFEDSLRGLIDTQKPSASLLLQKPTNQVAHAGGMRISPDSDAAKALAKWVEVFAATPPRKRTVVKSAPGETTLLRRLTHAQYDNTVRDLLGDNTRPSRQFPPEDFIDGFRNQVHGQGISPILAESYSEAAEKVAAAANIKDTGPRFVAEFGLRAFRRPLTTAEQTRYAALYKEGGARLVVEGMLQSPAFLFRAETSAVPAHKPYARASRLSYLLWDTMPDQRLFDAAARGELNTATGFEATARRMLQDARARQAVDEFFAQWLRFDRVLGMVKERRSYPIFTRELSVAMTEETRRLASTLVWDNANFMDFFTAGHTYVNGDLAGLYRMQAPAEEFAKVTYPAGSGRAGVLGHASFLALTSKPGDTSPTARGLFVREQFLCQQVPQPPPGVNQNLPVNRQEKPMTNRERLKVHLENPSCATCHNLIDPIGFGLERFDGVGAYREKAKIDILPYDRREQIKSVELPIAADGFVAGIQASEFTTPEGLGKALAGNQQCQECVVKQFFRYAMGRHETKPDRETIRLIAADFRQSGFKFQELMISLIKRTEFAGRE